MCAATKSAPTISGLLLFACGVLWTGCAGSDGSEPASIRLLEFPQAGSRGVRLNESLQFQFSAELDRSSITGASFKIVDASGRRAKGRVQQRSSTLQFIPDLPLRGDLTDAGLLPGRTYSVHLLGFPAPDGIRGLGGEPLRESHVFQFKTAGAVGDEAVFLPPISRGLPLVFWCEQRNLRPSDKQGILLETVEAIDPRSVHDEAFELISQWGDADPERIALRARVEVNEADHAVISLRPILDPRRPNAFRVLDPGRYYLAERPDVRRFQTLGGLGITPIWSASGEPGLVLGVAEPQVRSRREEFDDPEGGSPIQVLGVDGTAFLDGAGEVSVRFPAAAGSGEDGWVENLALALADSSQATVIDLHGTRVTLPVGQGGQELDLSLVTGPVVIRAQRSLELAGVLKRRGGRASESIGSWIQRRQLEQFEAVTALREFEAAHPPGDQSEQEAQLHGMLTQRLGRAEEALDLSSFVEDALTEQMPWTILVAGGDVRITGGVDIEGELLIAAGGWIRVPGRVSAGAAWTTPEGGGNFRGLRDVPNSLPLRIDPPEANPLREPLKVAIVSRPIRPQGGVADWLGLTTSAREGRGRVHVRATGEWELGRGSKETESFGPVDDLGLLRGCASLRLVIELTMDPDPNAAVWDPPRVDAVEVTWKPPSRTPQDPDGTGGVADSGR